MAPVLPSGTAAVHSHGRTVKLRVPANWALLAVLIVQAALSLRLVRADTAFEDEATYLWAGHLEWAHVLHGTPLPQFPAYFSGAPVLYPPIGALADSVGGLTGARILSLIFMLGATVALRGTAPAVRAPGRALRRRAVRLHRPDVAPGSVRHLRRHVDIPDGAGRVARGRGRRAKGRDHLDDRGRSRAGAGRRDCVHVRPVRHRRAPARSGHRVPAARRQVRRLAPADHPGRRGGAPHARRADRRKPLPARNRADDGIPRGRYRLPAHRPRPVLVVDRRRRRRGGVRRRVQLGHPARTARRPGC